MSDQVKLQTVIISHGGYPNAHANHLPLWKAQAQAYGGSVLTFFPAESATPDVPSRFLAPPEIINGKAEKEEPLSTERLIWLLKHLNDKCAGMTHFLLYSWCTLPLETLLPESWFDKDVLWGKFPDRGDDQLAVAPRPTYPLFFSRAILKKLIAGLEKLPADPNLKYWDAAIESLVQDEAVPYGSLGRQVFACDPLISPSDETAALNAIRAGAFILHGVDSRVLHNRNVRMYTAVYNDVKNEVVQEAAAPSIVKAPPAPRLQVPRRQVMVQTVLPPKATPSPSHARPAFKPAVR